MICPSCATENEPGRKFCGECGSPLARACPACGTANVPTVKFCGECGTRLDAAEQTARTEAPAPHAAERRLVSVLFADLVGFTALSETRDAEEVRELLANYFETARRLIERYGGTVEKFIGDAVMAVWGTPVAQEDDAERAVRAGLDLVDAVEAFGVEAGAPELRARAGVLTGETAVTLGAEGQGMVAGDLVNTASRVQGAAEPGTVLVGAATKRATEAAIVYEDAGTYELKGKAEPVELWRAIRVVAARRGGGRSAGLEAPFVGRDREFRLVKDLFHVTADEHRATLVSVVGVAGIGKSRLAWEFEKYVDGLVDDVWWHRGRCLAYGEGVAFWALAEMVRMRARIAEDEDDESASRKLHEAVVLHVADLGERDWVEPRLQHLLGLTERTAPDREDLFSAWRLLFERMAEKGPVVLVFEDLHWADAGLLDFVEYLLDWSRDYPLYVITLSRPELGDRHPTFGMRVRSATSLTLDPLADDAMDELLRGLVPGLPDDVRTTIRDRADGVPLYAVETVRMLLDRGLVEKEGDGYRLTAPVGALQVPETLHALIAARLDSLELLERRALEDAAVLGKTFTARGLAAVSGLADTELEPVLASLVRKELLVLQADPRSPERGQFGFLQALVQRVAYETLSRRDRKARHLAAASYLAEGAGIDPDEIAEVIAAHYLDAQAAEPESDGAETLKANAREWLSRAGERAASLAATDDAQRAFEQAADLAGGPVERARLLERAGELARAGNRVDQAERHLREAHALCDEAGASHDAARVAAALGVAVWQLGRIEEAIDLMERAHAVLSSDEPDADMATLAAQLGRLHFFAGNSDDARRWIEQALDVAEGLQLPAVIASALNTKSILLMSRRHESHALIGEALRVALDNNLGSEALRAYNNLVVLLDAEDRPEEIRPVQEEALALARRRGDRFWEIRFVGALCVQRRFDGEWDEVAALVDLLPGADESVDVLVATAYCALASIAVERGDAAQAHTWLAPVPEVESSDDRQLLAITGWKRELLAQADGRLEDALEIVTRQMPAVVELGQSWSIALLLGDAAKLALALGRPAAATAAAEPCNALPPGQHTRVLDSQLFRIRANTAAASGDQEAAADAYGVALAASRNLGQAYWLATVLFDYGRWLVDTGRTEEGAVLLAEARALFERMRATAWLERLDAVLPAAASA